VIFGVSLKVASYTLRPIKESNQRLKEYNHHVAHELKTPLAVLKSNLELAQISGDIDDVVCSK
jgi:signal transduction histidine kinase